MKIEGNRPSTDTEATEASKKAAGEKQVQRTGVDRTSKATTDRVEVSEDAKLLTSALDAAQKAPAIRTELVERLKQKLAKGEVGNDSAKLADRLIDDLLNG